MTRGRKITLLSIVVLTVINAGLAFYWINRSQADIITSFTTQYPLIDPARNFIAQEHYIVNLQPLREKLKAMTSDFGKTSVSIYVEFLNTGGNISINPEVYIWPASLTKVPLAMAVMKKIENNQWQLHNELVLMQGDGDDKSGNADHPLSDNPIGTRFTIERLLEELLVNSDNTAYFILLRNVHKDDLKSVIEGLGIEALFSEQGRISAKEYSRVLRSLYTASFLSRSNSEKILEWLDASEFNDFIAGSVPQTIPFPHKYGEHIPLNAYSDSGIVYLPNRPYIISVMVQGKEGEPFDQERRLASEFMRSVSKEVYAYFSGYGQEK